MNTKMTDDIIRYCDSHGEDAVTMVQDYMLEKDSRLSRFECETLVNKRRAEMKANPSQRCKGGCGSMTFVPNGYCSMCNVDILAKANIYAPFKEA